MSKAGLIAIDWGSTKFRAHLLAEDYSLLEKIETQDGVMQAAKLPHEVFTTNCQQWLVQDPSLPVIMSGTVGSNIGWVNTHYVTCPLASDCLKGELVPVENNMGVNIKIVPGVRGLGLSDTADVMRGEEVQVFGAISLTQNSDAVVCLPGTHSKWVQIDNRQITRFATFMSGEFYFLTRMKSSISSIVDSYQFDRASFITGLETAQKSGGLLHHLFSARANSLVKENGYCSTSSYISGLIIGSELHEMVPRLNQNDEIVLVANDSLLNNYQIAMEYHGLDPVCVASEAAFIEGIKLIDPLQVGG